MKRIALIRNSYSYDFGGAEIFPINVAKITNSLGYETVILSANDKTLSAATANNIKARRSPWWSFQNFSGIRLLAFPLYLIWIAFVTIWYFAYFLKNRIDIVHPQSRDDFIAATVAAKLLGRTVIWTDHADLKYVFMNHGVWYKNPVGKFVYAVSLLADKVTLESSSEMRLIESALGGSLPANYGLIHIGVVDRYTPTNRASKELTLVSTSRLVKAKGIGELIEAFKAIDNDGVVLKLCGDGPEAEHFKSLAGGVKNIRFLGHVDNILEELQNSDIFIHPSYHESFGLSLVEAEMCSLPIIACNVGSIPEIVKDGVSGILVEPRESRGLAEAMKTLVKDPALRSKMGQAGRQIFLDNFQLDKIVKDKFLPLYEK